MCMQHYCTVNSYYERRNDSRVSAEAKPSSQTSQLTTAQQHLQHTRECLCYSIVMQDMFDVMVLPLISEEFSILVGCRFFRAWHVSASREYLLIVFDLPLCVVGKPYTYWARLVSIRTRRQKCPVSPVSASMRRPNTQYLSLIHI